MILATSITQSYLERSRPLFESGRLHWRDQRICFCIGFDGVIDGWECITVLATDNKWEPANRPGYKSLQHGEFVKYYDFDDDDIVCFVDSDMVLQKDFYTGQSFNDKFYVTNSSFPATHLYDVYKNIGCGNGPINTIGTEFCACFMIAKVSLWWKLYWEVNENIGMINVFKHHAAWQLLINIVIIKSFPYFVMPAKFCNAIWYTGTKAYEKDGQLWINDELVYFNHTKFDERWKTNK